jgi:hypothetical protein
MSKRRSVGPPAGLLKSLNREPTVSEELRWSRARAVYIARAAVVLATAEIIFVLYIKGDPLIMFTTILFSVSVALFLVMDHIHILVVAMVLAGYLFFAIVCSWLLWLWIRENLFSPGTWLELRRVLK